MKARWFRAQGARRPEEVAGALAFIAWRVARNMLARMRKAGFAIDAGPGYFDFLQEALVFCIQVAWRLAYPRLDEAQREAFIQALAHAVARTLADNESELLGERSGGVEARFLERLNRGFDDYAAYGYDADGPRFDFLRGFASLIAERVPEEDRRWVHDQVIAIEGPEAAATLARSLAALMDAGPAREPRRRAAQPAP